MSLFAETIILKPHNIVQHSLNTKQYAINLRSVDGELLFVIPDKQLNHVAFDVDPIWVGNKVRVFIHTN